MRIRTHHEAMFPIAQINTHHVMQKALIGARACDPVVPERAKRRKRAARQRAPRRMLVLKLRGTS
jgi:hypothetical protein